jgi:hypothetical protein
MIVYCKNLKLLCAVLIVSIFAVCSCNFSSAKKIPPKAVKGVMNLEAWDLDNDGPVDLVGEYEFYWKRLLDPQHFASGDPTRQPDFINVPGYWNEFESAGEKLTGDGYATYRLKVLLNARDQSLTLKVLDMSTAFTLFVNGEKRKRGKGSQGVP